MTLPPIHYQPQDVTQRLADLGLKPEQLRKAVEVGDAARKACTALHPAWYPGMAQNADTVRGIREELLPIGWRATRMRSLELVVAKDDGHAIAVASGDSSTGDPERIPQSRYPKGASTIIAVLQNNNGQGTFNFEGRILSTRQHGVRRRTWFLLIYSAPHEVRYELSLPKTISKHEYKIIDWQERILFPAIARDPTPNTPRADDEDDIPVNVKRRAQ